MSEKFPAELLCVDADTLVRAIDTPDQLSEAVRTHLRLCGTCRSDVSETRREDLSREAAQQIFAYAASKAERPKRNG